MVTFAKVVDGSVTTTENTSWDHCQSYDQTKRSNVSPGRKPFTVYIPLFRQNDMVFTDLEPSITVSNNLTQPRAEFEYMDIIEIRTDENKTQSANQGANYAVLHPSTRSWEVERDHVTI